MKSIPQYDIDLTLDAEERIAPLVKSHRADGRRILDESLGDMGLKEGFLVNLAKRALGGLYEFTGGHWQDEVDAWAEALDRPASDVLTANLSYELAQFAGGVSSRWSKFMDPFPCFGCTAVAVPAPKGWYHARHLDWPLKAMRGRTMVVHATNGKRRSTRMTFPAMVGVLSGMVPGKFAVTLNWAPPDELPGFDFGPSFLLRYVLEEAADFDEAVAFLSGTPLAAPALFMVTGPRRADACVVERTRKDARVREPEDGVLVLGNHYLSKAFRDRNDPEYDSEERCDTTLDRVLRRKATTPAGMLRKLQSTFKRGA